MYREKNGGKYFLFIIKMFILAIAMCNDTCKYYRLPKIDNNRA